MRAFDLNIDAGDLHAAAEMAKRLGFSGISVFVPEAEAAALKKNFPDMELASTFVARAESVEELKNGIEKNREKYEVLAVSGGTYEINRAACEDSRVDVLFHPESGRSDSGIDHICAKAASENNVAVEINFNEMLKSRNRSRQMFFISHNIELCRKYGTKMVATSGARNIWEMRAPRELASIAHVLGLELKAAIDSVSSVPESIISINREKLSGERYGDVKIVKGDEYGKA